MESILKVLADNLQNSLISGFLILVLAFMWLFKKEIPLWVNLLLNLKYRLTTKSLQHHDLFNTCARVEKEVLLMKFYTHGKYDVVKSKMCQDFTKHKIAICSKEFKNILELNIENMSSDEFKIHIVKSQLQMHLNYINEIKKDWREKGIPNNDIEYIIGLFETFRYDVVQGFEYRINSIFSSTSHGNNTRKLLAIFEMWAFGIDMLPRDMQITFETVNGRFQKIKY